MVESIHCCVVDDHCDIVPFLHACWKSKILPVDGLSLIHVDSHPDLSPPPTSVEKFTDSEHLYEILEGVGGIAEFILPLAYNGHFNRGIIWLHPEWSHQLPIESTNFHIGDANGRCGVTLMEPYYLVAGVVYDISELRNTQVVDITQCDAASSLPAWNSPSSESLPANWVLDICLDYFSVCNPFLMKLETTLIRTNSPLTCSELLDMIAGMFQSACFHRRPTECNCRSLAQRRSDCSKFDSLVNALLEWKYEETSGVGGQDEEGGGRGEDCPCGGATRDTSAARTFHSNDKAHETFASLREDFLSLFVCHCTIPGPTGGGSDAIDLPNTKAAVSFVDILPTLHVSIRQVLRETGIPELATLPHHVSSAEEVRGSIAQLAFFLSTCGRAYQCPPSVICIARSDGDGYTSAGIVEDLQEQVVSMLESLCEKEWGGAGLVMHDIRTDCYVKCREMFLGVRLDTAMTSRKRKLLEESGYKFSVP